MRPTRTTGALVTLTLAAALAPATTSPSVADGGRLDDRPPHDLVANGSEIGTSDTFLVRGRVSTLANGRIKVLRSVSAGKYTVWKRLGTSATGRFRTRIYQVGHQRTCFKVSVHATSGYRRTVSPNVGCIFIDRTASQ